jgi:uncharacterized membrane protein YeaQ/YmgE (transglycosylase-associated protein family)
MNILDYSTYELLMFLAVAAICAGIGQALAGYSIGGFLISLVLGFAGAWLGAWTAGQLDLPQFYTLQFADQPFPIVWAVAGSVLFAIIISLLTQRALVDI